MTDKWIEVIKYLVNNNKQLLMADPGRDSFRKLLDDISNGARLPFEWIRHHIKEPRKQTHI